MRRAGYLFFYGFIFIVGIVMTIYFFNTKYMVIGSVPTIYGLSLFFTELDRKDLLTFIYGVILMLCSVAIFYHVMCTSNPMIITLILLVDSFGMIGVSIMLLFSNY